MINNPFEKSLGIFPKKQEARKEMVEVIEIDKDGKVQEPYIVESVDGVVTFEPAYVKILKEYNGIESNIPINNPYWKVRP
jgi:hypothetical protein